MRASESVGRAGFRCLEWCCFPFLLMPVQALLGTSADEVVFILLFAAYALFLAGVGVLIFNEPDRKVRAIGFALYALYATVQGYLWWSLL